MPKRNAETSDSSGSAAKSAKANGCPTVGWQDAPDLHVYASGDVPSRSRIAAFDIDGTIITTKSGKTFAKDENDWKFLYPEIPARLNRLHDTEDFKIVFMTNQKGLSTGKVSLAGFKRKIEAICKLIKAPVQVFVSPGALKYRKPYTGMWDKLQTDCNANVAVNRDESVFVGDAAGRPAVGARKKDFSCSDRLFALNLGVTFKTPEEFFLNQKPSTNFAMPEFCPKTFMSKPPSQLLNPASAKLISDHQPELIVMVGAPGSGKSHFAKNHLVPKGYEWINRDTLKTWQKCVKATEDALAAGKSVIVDNTDPDVESRARYVKVAKAKNIPCRCFDMNIGKAQAFHNNRFRLIVGADKEHQGVNDMVMNMHFSKYKQPSTSEGFDEVVKVNFVPEFEDQHERQVYSMYLVEK